MSLDSFRNIIDRMCLQIIYDIYMYKQDLASNNLQWLICHKTKPNQTWKSFLVFFYESNKI